jgi:hypothetical protein
MAFSYRTTCKKCGSVWPGVVGLVHMINGMIKDTGDLWKAVVALGGKKQEPARPRKQVKNPGECEHFLGWLQMASGAGAPGRSHSYTLRCIGCRQGWSNAGGLQVLFGKLKENQAAIWSEVKRLESR